MSTRPTFSSSLRDVENSRPRLSVIGTGYLGATHAVCMVELGFDVIGLDVDEAKVAALRSGQPGFWANAPTRMPARLANA